MARAYLQAIASDVSVDTVTKQAAPYVGASAGAPGASATTVTNTQTTPATPVQMTATAGGSAICWVTPPLANATSFATPNAPTTNLRALVDNAAANARIYVKVTRLRSGVETTMWIWTSGTDGTSLTTADAVATIGGETLTNITNQVGDRYVIRVYIGGSTMATGHTVTMSYDGEATTAAGETFITFNNGEVFRAGLAVGCLAATPRAPGTAGKTIAIGSKGRLQRKALPAFSAGVESP